MLERQEGLVRIVVIWERRSVSLKEQLPLRIVGPGCQIFWVFKRRGKSGVLQNMSHLTIIQKI